MATPRRVAVVVGSLRKDSLNRKMAQGAGRDRAAVALARDRRDRRAAALQPGRRRQPAARRRSPSRQKIAGADAVLFVTPEYNRSVPGRAEERDRHRLAALRQERLERQAGGGDHRLAGRDRRLRREPPPAPVAGLPQHAGAAAARGLHRRRRRSVRRSRRPQEAGDARSSSTSSSPRSPPGSSERARRQPERPRAGAPRGRLRGGCFWRAGALGAGAFVEVAFFDAAFFGAAFFARRLLRRLLRSRLRASHVSLCRRFFALSPSWRGFLTRGLAPSASPLSGLRLPRRRRKRARVARRRCLRRAGKRTPLASCR